MQRPKRTLRGSLEYGLGYIAHKSRFPGDKIVLKGQTDYPVCFARNPDKFEFYVQNARKAGFLDGKRESMRSDYLYWLTTTGWEEAKRILMDAVLFLGEIGQEAKTATPAITQLLKEKDGTVLR